MAPEKAPAFQFYPKDFLMDGRVASMTLEERGAYITLLCLCWTETTLPVEPKRLAQMIGCSKAAFTRVWPALSACFCQVDGALRHGRLDKERQNQADYRAKQKAKADKRWSDATASSRHMPEPSRKHALRSPVSDLQSPISDLQNVIAQTEQRASTTIPRAPKPALVGDGRFQRFWAVYPNKKGKDEALKAWSRRHPTEALTDLIVAAIEQQKLWPDWTKDSGRFIPHPATWLNRGSWDDEPTAAAVSRVSDVGRQNAANAEEAMRIMEERDAAHR